MAKKGLYSRGELVMWADPAEPMFPKVVEYVKLYERGSDHATVKRLWSPHGYIVVPLTALSKHPMNQ
jgi:hypothetical protein